MADPKLLVAYTHLLKSRLASAGRIDVNIMQISEAERPAKFDEHLGRFLGWFISTDGKPGLLLLAREHIDQNITHVFVLYSNSNYDEFPLMLMCELSKKLVGGPKSAVVNIISPTPEFCNYSLLLESAEFIISRDIFTRKPPLYLDMDGPGSIVAPRAFKDIRTVCNHDVTQDTAIVNQMLLANKFIFADISQTLDFPATFDILRIRVGSHYIYAVHCPDRLTILLLMPHVEQLPNDHNLVLLEERLDARFPNRFKSFYSVRPRFASDCASPDMLKICILLTKLPLLYVEKSDLVTAFEELNILSIDIPRSRASQSPRSSQESAKSTGYKGPKPVVRLSLHGRNRRPEVLSVKNHTADPQPLSSQESIRRDMNAYTAWMAAMDDVTLSHPSIGLATASHVPSGTILTKESWFIEQIRLVKRYWDQFARTKLLAVFDLASANQSVTWHIDDKDVRFVILPVNNFPDTSATGFLIFDKDVSTWSWMHPNNSAANTREVLSKIKAMLSTHFPRYSKWKGDVLIISGTYHKDFPYVHLVMALFYIAKLFCYAVKLPAKVVYNEREFRVFAHKSCLAVQIANQKHNLANNLISEDGTLLSGAYYSLPSPIQYERSVVPSDLCGFCKRRGFANLGRHICMQHGGQAIAANFARIIKFGYSRKD